MKNWKKIFRQSKVCGSRTWKFMVWRTFRLTKYWGRWRDWGSQTRKSSNTIWSKHLERGNTREELFFIPGSPLKYPVKWISPSIPLTPTDVLSKLEVVSEGRLLRAVVKSWSINRFLRHEFHDLHLGPFRPVRGVGLHGEEPPAQRRLEESQQREPDSSTDIRCEGGGGEFLLLIWRSLRCLRVWDWAGSEARDPPVPGLLSLHTLRHRQLDLLHHQPHG